MCSKSTGTQTVLPETADENPSLSKDQLPILVPVPPSNSDPVNEYSNLSEDDKSSDDESELNSDDSDEDSQVSSAETASDEKLESIVLSSSKPPQEQKKFIVFEEALIKCFDTCFKCKSPCAVVLESTIGTFCQISVKCSYDSNHCFSWSTGPIHNRLPLLHLMITSRILASGLECSKVLRFFDPLKIKCFTRMQYCLGQEKSCIGSRNLGDVSLYCIRYACRQPRLFGFVRIGKQFRYGKKCDTGHTNY